MRRSTSFANLPDNAARHVITSQQLRRTPRVPVALCISPPLVLVIGRLRPVVLGNIVKHEAASILILENAAFPAHSLRYENASNAGGPDHACGMELNKFHVHEGCARLVSQ